MLKIKDNVDLKELEKYGFSKIEGNNDGYKYLDWENGFYICEKDEEFPINERKITREYSTSGCGFTDYDLDVIYDLIKDGLVEKVEE